jgi:hypothetical protein
MGTRYRCFGLDVEAGIDLPEFQPALPGVAPDIVVRIDRAAREGADSVDTSERRDAEFAPVGDAIAGGGVAMEVAGAGCFLVRDGREILVWPAEDADPGALRLVVIGSAMGMALHQRGLLVMHGAAVEVAPGQAALLVGESGAGKSTLAAHLGLRGHAVLGDDTMPLWPGDGGFDVWPGSRVFKLWGDAVEAIGASRTELQGVGNRIDKYFFPNNAAAADRPARLAEVILLDCGADGTAPRLEPLTGVTALRALAVNTYRPAYVTLLDREPDHFRQCADVAGALDVWRLVRPWDIGQVKATLDLLARHWKAVPVGRAALPR